MRLLGFALAGALAATASPAAAAVVETHRHGQWATIEGTTPGGSRVCGVATMEGEAPSRYVGVKFFPDLGQLDVHISKPSWSIPSGTSVEVEIAFSGSPGAWSTRTAAGKGDMVTFAINPRKAAEFLVELSLASRGTIRFGGDEAPWAINLAGSGAAVRAMLECVGRSRGAPSATQPYASAPKPEPATPSVPYTPSTEPPMPQRPSIGIGRERRT